MTRRFARAAQPLPFAAAAVVVTALGTALALRWGVNQGAAPLLGAVAGVMLLAVAGRVRSRPDAGQPPVSAAELLSGLVRAEEAVRGQLAAELHDTVAQSLAVARELLSSPTGDLPLPLLSDVVADAEEQVRALMARARPPALADGDLAQAVQALCSDLLMRYAFAVRLSWPSAPYRLPLSAATTLYRFFGEALLNAVKHADVDEAHATLEVAGGTVVATVVDTGPGFDPARVTSVGGRHVGLSLLRERARLCGGTLEVSSQPGYGTTLVLRLPGTALPQRSAGSGPAALLSAGR